MEETARRTTRRATSASWRIFAELDKPKRTPIEDEPNIDAGKHVSAMFIAVRAIFLPGGAVIHLPEKFLQVAQIFTKRSKGN